MNLILGCRGRLGTAITASFEPGQMIALDRLDYSEWWRSDSEDAIARFLEKRAKDGGSVYIAAGIIDPGAARDDHQRINFLLARNVASAAAMAGLRTVTFGTVMEKVANNKANSYYESKIMLGDWAAEAAVRGVPILHVRLHTLYGGVTPDRFMFLGQIFQALSRGESFNMTSGEQLREYHHIDDEVLAVRILAGSDLAGTADLSHGAPVRLRDLAKFIFEAFGASELLSIGALTAPSSDNYSTIFERLPLLKTVPFRDTLPSVVNYLRSCLH
jgi:nucleoside-diphosphate-sugar epimerase